MRAARSVKASSEVALGWWKRKSSVKSSRQLEASRSMKFSLPAISLAVRPFPVTIVSSVKRASSQVNGAPLCHRTPSGKYSVSPWASSWFVHPRARSGMISPAL